MGLPTAREEISTGSREKGSIYKSTRAQKSRYMGDTILSITEKRADT